MSGRLLHVWAGFRSRQGFPGRGIVFWFCVTTGVPCVTTGVPCVTVTPQIPKGHFFIIIFQ